jgi:hypothetical protein
LWEQILCYGILSFHSGGDLDWVLVIGIEYGDSTFLWNTDSSHLCEGRWLN